jgi:hypothetical protein
MLAGCGGPATGSVSGKVSYKGQALKGGTVTFIPKSGDPHTSPIQEDGSYAMAKIPAGAATITVETTSVRPIPKSSLPGPYSKMAKDVVKEGIGPPGESGDAKRYVPIPLNYADHAKSGLSLDVQSGPQTHNIDLK